MTGDLLTLAADPPTALTAPLLQAGAIGAICVAMGWVHLSFIRDLRGQRDAERARADRAEQALAVLNQEVRQQVVPVLERVAERLVGAWSAERGKR